VTAATHRYRELEAAARRPTGAGVLHPDRCPKLTLHGVAFAIPPRGGRVSPVFGPHGVTVALDGMESCPQAEALLTSAPVRTDGTCASCGRPAPGPLEVDPEGDVAFLAAAFELAARLLDSQYDLTEEQKADLLAFDSDRVPRWLVQLLRWCAGLGPGEG